MALAPELNPEWAAQPLALTRHQGRTVLLMSDPGGEPLDGLIEQNKGRPLDLVRLLKTAIGLASVLSRAHRQGVIHKDVKPANALVDDSGRAWLTGFGIATRLHRERPQAVPPEFIAGTFAYMSPEQTGRMNRSVDSRSDLYSLGVTLYELFTGELPFAGADPMEWVHCHIARQPLPPVKRRPDIPLLVSAVIMKLLAKTADERYQTAVGLTRDLQRCLREWKTHGRVEAFALGEDDTPDRLLIPEKLYGRAAEIEILLASFERVVGSGKSELVLVSGHSGIGKSSVVNELHKALVPPRGHFASGKFDQYKHDIPYATLAQAFQGLIRQILAKDDQELKVWRNAIMDALGSNAQIIIDLVPDLKHAIGDQQPVAELPPQDAQNRLKLVFRRFVSVFTRDHPLALFLDDLQWLDTASLDLMEDLLTHPDVKHLLLVGAYRNNEVTSAHAFFQKIEAIQHAGTLVSHVVLGPLTRSDLQELVEDTLHCVPSRARPLAELLEERTDGNPFFTIQFLSALAEDALLTFDYGDGRWSWDLNRIRTRGYTNNVVDLMVHKLNRLSNGAQQALQHLACLGNSASLATLRMVYLESDEQLHEHLWEAAQAGLISRSQETYRFVHDRIQEAAYSLIPLQARAEEHLRIGLLMETRIPADELEEVIFEVAIQLNHGAHLVTGMVERERIARVNLAAGRRAKLSTAYASALEYLRAGRDCLTHAAWDQNYDLVFAIECLLAECEMLTANAVAVEERLGLLANRACNAHDLALVTRLRLTLYELIGQSERGVEVFIEYQRGRGFEWSTHPDDDEVLQEYDRIWSLLGARELEDLVDLPLITDRDLLDDLAVLTEVVLQAMYINSGLLALVLCRMVCISIEHGNSDAACFAYVSLGMLAGPRFSNYQAGFRLGKLGLDLVEKRGLRRYQARVYLRFGSHIVPWGQHVREGRDLLRQAFDAANMAGDLTFAAYSFNNLNTILLAAGVCLTDVQLHGEAGLQFAERLRFGRAIASIAPQLALVRSLRGLTDKFGSLSDGSFDEVGFEEQVATRSALLIPCCFYWIRKLQARYLACDYAGALEASAKAKPLLWASSSFFEAAEYHFYSALAIAGHLESVSDESRGEYLNALIGHQAQLAIWNANCPETFEDRFVLVHAEVARVELRDIDAMRLYERAIACAHASGFIHNEAIVCEIAGGFHLSRDIETAGYAYLGRARNCYDRWGAAGKVKQLDERYPRLRAGRLSLPSAASGDPVAQLDVETVVKASQAISSEMLLPSLIQTLMRIAMEHAGAERGVLMQIREEGLKVEAEAITGSGRIEITHQPAIVGPLDLPQSILQVVARTQERVLLDDASIDLIYSKDEYIQHKRARSILCLPIVKQGTLFGVLYLENNLASGVFTYGKVAVLQLLASQAAISLGSAGLFAGLQRSEAFLAQGQRISHTGSFGWRVENEQYYWSNETYDILEYGLDVRASMDLTLQRTHPDDHDRVKRAFDQPLSEERESDFDIEYRLMMPDGRIKHVHATGRRADAGDLDFVGAIRDITERKRAEVNLRQALTDLAHISRVTTMGELTASLAHEISQPIVAVIANAEASLRWLDRDPPKFEKTRESAERIVRDGHRAAQIIDRIRAQFKKEVLEPAVFCINEIVGETVELLSREAQRFDISVRAELETGLPSVVGDRVQIQQVMMNLILNSIEATKASDGLREMVVKSERADDEWILVSVSDTGAGVPPQLAQQIFDPFFTTKPHGTGMGLRISRSIVEAHGGRLWVSEGPRRGAVFQFMIPGAGGNTEVPAELRSR
ncbi:trifunctional serine/threonine-protein kinase/ATP-binding protein/sensor histidine kinase [Paraburkholderia unamae]|uniref:histidine kinase n=1 Tax=Paraburkholderia unamae TaxID=219649 RepID=A0ABX5KTH5_9BURK|nr:AAA family ATPase [Paraburkholderia unamae]PVX85923.1 PAS domain S-box-containing protein [Paraburkholderia unamae]